MGIIIPAAALFYREFVRFTDELALPFQSYLQIVPTSFFLFFKIDGGTFQFYIYQDASTMRFVYS